MPVDDHRYNNVWHRAATRSWALVLVFVIVGLATGLLGSWVFAPAAGWIAGAGTFLVWVWATVARMGPEDTATHATREDPTRAVSQTLLLVASLASFGAVAILLIESGTVQGFARVALAAAALITIAISWFLVHTLYTLRYAAAYYGAGGTGINFNQSDPPQYSDFAYFAFTLGMTYQVSDTNISVHAIRIDALRHGLLSFLLGVVVLATTINVISSLAR